MTATPQPSPEHKPVLLIVDDDQLITDTLSFALGADFEIHACESRRHAIELMRQLPDAPQLRPLRTKVAMVFQGFHLFPHLTALGNVTLAPIQVGRVDRQAAEISSVCRAAFLTESSTMLAALHLVCSG